MPLPDLPGSPITQYNRVMMGVVAIFDDFDYPTLMANEGTDIPVVCAHVSLHTPVPEVRLRLCAGFNVLNCVYRIRFIIDS